MKRFSGLAILFLLLSGVAEAQTYTLSVSPNSNRASAVALTGATVPNPAYIFTSLASNPLAACLTGVSAVSYWLDAPTTASPIHTEHNVPYDFAGSTTSDCTALAVPWNSSSVAAGVHTVTQVVTLSNGTTETDSASFCVQTCYSAEVQFLYDDGTPMAGTCYLFSEGAAETQVDSNKLDATGTVGTRVTLDPTKSYRLEFIVSPGGQVLTGPPTVPMPSSLSSSILSALLHNKVVVRLRKSDLSIAAPPQLIAR